MVKAPRLLPRQLLDSTTTVPQSLMNSSVGGGYVAGGSFDSQMIVILVALLGALLCAMSLTSIIRCVLRVTRRRIGAPQEACGGLPPMKEELSWIPVVAYKHGEVAATECPICLGEYVDGEDVGILPRCNHGFHVACVGKWLALHSSCPTCRQLLIDVTPGK